ncbi:MAG TPA: cobamide remodeling phosphodiesterase CbiR [Anaerolineaceae bacterium]
MKPFPGLPFRIGTTSYIIPEEILPNVRFLAGLVEDVELVLFDFADATNNYPPEAALVEMKALAQQAGLTYTVHLPLDLRLCAQDGQPHASMLKARQVIQLTQTLDPWAYVAHLDGHAERLSSDPAVLQAWNDQAVRALETVAGWAGGADHLAVENLETYPLHFWDDVLRRAPVSCCVDIGHLWLDGHDPLPFLAGRLARTRVLHIHGRGERDHQPLSHVPTDELARVLAYLVQVDYRGVLTLEIFGEDDLRGSMQAMQTALARL